MANAILTQERLKELLHYNPDTGIFTWLVIGKNRIKKTRIAGSKTKDGYIKITIDGIGYFAHRLAFLYMNGKYPDNFTDHINGTKTDNYWKNLRDANVIQNNRNAKKRKDNTSGFKGVSKFRDKWEARCRTENGRIHLGFFKTPEEASQAYIDYSKKVFGDFHTTR